MASEDGIVISDELTIPEWELSEVFIRAGGPGGQNVNKVATAVQLRWNVASSSLPANVKIKITRRWRTRITQDDDIVIEARRHRRQSLNRADARKRLKVMIETALKPRKYRVATRPSRNSVKRRLARKTKRGQVKALRGRVKDEDS